MRRKIRVSFPKIVKEVLCEDMNYFGMKGETLFNLVIENLGFEKLLEIPMDLLDDKASIVFNLNESNTKLLPLMLRASNIGVEAEFLRKVFITYINLHPSIRQRKIQRELFLKLEEGIRKKRKMKIYHQEKLWEILGMSLEREEGTGYVYLRAKDKDNEYHFAVKEIEYIY